MRETVRAWIHGKLVGVDCWMFLMTPYKASQEFHMRLNCATRAQCTQWRNDVSKRESNRPLGSPMMSLQKYSLKRRKWPLCVCAPIKDVRIGGKSRLNGTDLRRVNVCCCFCGFVFTESAPPPGLASKAEGSTAWSVIDDSLSTIHY